MANLSQEFTFTPWVVIAALMSAIVYYSSRRGRLPLPPGPPSKGFAGNANELPLNEPWTAYQRWYRAYGPIVHIRLFNHHVIVLNTAKAVSDLLDKRSNIYSDRPKRWMHHELVGKKYTVFNVSSEDTRFKRYRRVLTSSLNTRAVRNYHEVMRSEARVLLQGLLSKPEKFLDHIRRNAAATIMKVAYGYTISDEDDHFIGLVHKSLKLAGQSNQPGRWLVDYFPILRFIPVWFPGADFKRQAKYFRSEQNKLTMVPHQWAKNDYVESFTSRLLRPDGSGSNNVKHLSAEEDDIIMNLGGGLYTGAADTTFSALTTFFLVMCLYPDIQHRAQAEIDEHVGRDRLPSFEDKHSLPYVQAVMREILRWAPVAPLGLPHAVTQDDEYEGYRIPRGATIIANIGAIMHDETMYPEPHQFNPERFLQRKLEHEECQADPYNFAFGFGRRACPGSYFAQESLFLIIASVLSTFDITKARDDITGKEIEPEIAFTGSATSHAKPFRCRITLRTDATSLT